MTGSDFERAEMTNELEEREKPRMDRVRKSFEAFGALMRTGGTGLIVEGRFGDPYYSGDSASLFTVANVTESNGETHLEPLKLAWGEFSKNTFDEPLTDPSADDDPYGEQQQHVQSLRAMRALGIPLVVVPQLESHFDFGDKDTRLRFLADPLRYLGEHIKIGMVNGEVVGRGWRDEPIDLSKTNVPEYHTLLSRLRNGIIQSRTTPEAFADFLASIPDNPVELTNWARTCLRTQAVPRREHRFLTPREQERQVALKHIQLLSQMGIDQPYALGWGEENEATIQDVLALKAQFDFEQNRFRE